MSRVQKEVVIESLKEGFSDSNAATFLIGFKGLPVVGMQKLRRQLREQGGVCKVAKARLMKKAASDFSHVSELNPYFKQQVAVVFAPSNAFAIAKILNDFSKEYEALNIVVGCLDARLLDKQMVVRVASLPSREVMLSMVCGTLQAPIATFVRLIKQIEEQKAGNSVAAV